MLKCLLWFNMYARRRCMHGTCIWYMYMYYMPIYYLSQLSARRRVITANILDAPIFYILNFSNIPSPPKISTRE